jgi:hypothetical protein
VKPGETVTPKLIAKTQAELGKLLGRRGELDHEINRLWQDLKMFRMVAIRADDDPGELPAFVGIDEQQRASQVKTEQRERANHAIDVSPEHQAGLRQANDLSAA